MQSHTNTRASRTQVQQEPVRVLHLRPSAPGTEEQSSHTPRSTPRVRWTEDVVDNEDMGKKKSKICCIFHPQREFGESSDESSSSSSDSSDDSDKEESKEPTKGCCNHKHKKEKSRKAGPNAYEKQPHYKNKSTVSKE